MTAFHAVVMAGGSGTRFWPLSRRSRPKQVLPLAGDRPLIVETLERVRALGAETRICCGPGLVAPISDCLGEDDGPSFIVEPASRNTGPCVLLSAARIEAECGSEDVIAFFPADHAIRPLSRFQEVCEAAVSHAATGDRLVILGIEPTHPATGYGWIERGQLDATYGTVRVHSVSSFCEKPAAETAERFLRSGLHSWNSGIFVFRARSLRSQLGRVAPALHDRYRELVSAFESGSEDQVTRAFLDLPATSFDRAVLEVAAADVVSADLEWDDLGSFRALAARQPADGRRNVTRLADGLAAVLVDSEGCFVTGNGEHTIALLGLQNLVVVRTADATLICPRDRVEDIRKVVAELETLGREDML